MRTIQEIFNVAIETKRYNPTHKGSITGSQFMCIALSDAVYKDQSIAVDEFILATTQVNKYLNKLTYDSKCEEVKNTLASVIANILNFELSAFAAGGEYLTMVLEIYTNWDARPLNVKQMESLAAKHLTSGIIYPKALT